MTTAENTHAGGARTPVMGFKNPANWATAAVVGPITAAVLVGGLKFIPTWAVYTVVGLVALWVVLKLVDTGIRRRPREEQLQDTAGVPG